MDTKCRFWDYDIRWDGCCHDWTLFQNYDIEKRVLKCELLSYELMSDITYSMKPYFYSPFKVGKRDYLKQRLIGVSSYSQQKMVVERTSCILKARWMI